MDDLVAFLRARLDEDEAAANVATAPGFAPEWAVHLKPPLQQICAASLPVASGADSVLPHIARHDPARVLRGVEAKRAAISEYAYLCEKALNPAPYPQPDEAGRFEVAAMMTRALAAEWSDHPDYQEDWKP